MTFNKIISWLGTIGGILFAVWAAKDPLKPYFEIHGWRNLAFLFGVLLCWGGAIAAIITYTALKYLNKNKKDELYLSTRANKNDLTHIIDIAKETLGNEVSSVTDLQKIASLDRNAIKVVKLKKSYTDGTETTTYKGYYIIYKLSPEGERAILKGGFHGASPEKEHIETSRKKCMSAYIAAIVGVDFRSRGHVLSLLIEKLKDGQFNKVKKFYARPTTHDGLELVLKKCFFPVDPSRSNIGNYYCADATELRKLYN